MFPEKNEIIINLQASGIFTCHESIGDVSLLDADADERDTLGGRMSL